MLSGRPTVREQPKATEDLVRPDMPALGLSARARKARELGMRAISLALSRPRMVVPRADYPPRRTDGILVLQRGENASSDYYLRPRLAGAGALTEIADLSQDPRVSRLLAPGAGQALTVVFCRYASPVWLQALEAVRGRLARVVLFMDDDLPAMMRAAEIPAAARGKAALHFGAHADRLSELCSEVWVSTQALADRYPEARARVLPPLPEAPPPEPSAETPALVVYHGTDVHEHERAFVLQVARRLVTLSPDARLELAGEASLVGAAGLSNVTVVSQLSWPDYLKAQTGRQAAISLAPLFDSPLNDARAPVKAFDAARLGAAGLFADAPAYRTAVRDGEDGLLLPMQPDAWAEAIAALLADPRRRLRLARAGRTRIIGLIGSDPGFPAAPGA